MVRPWPCYTIDHEGRSHDLNVARWVVHKDRFAAYLSLAPQGFISMDSAPMLHYLVNFFFPPRCAACDARLGSGAARRLCFDCHAHIDRMPDPLCDVCGVPLSAPRPDSQSNTDHSESPYVPATSNGTQW